MNLMPSGETNKDAPPVITGLAHTMGFNECEQIAEVQRLSEHICFVHAITLHLEVSLHWDCITPDDGYSIRQIQEDFHKSG